MEGEIFSSSFAAAAYLKWINFPLNKKVDIIGEDGIQLELKQAGINYIGGSEDGDKRIDLSPGQLKEHDLDVAAVVVGFDRYINYYKLQYATRCIRENPECMFIATNCDASVHLTESQGYAGACCMVGAIKGSTKKEPHVVGKPSIFMMDHVASKFNIKTSQICMVGDRLETDILFGQNGGCTTLLVLSGVTTLEMLQSTDNKIQPITPTRSQTYWLPRTLPMCEWTVQRHCLGFLKIRNTTILQFERQSHFVHNLNFRARFHAFHGQLDLAS